MPGRYPYLVQHRHRWVVRMIVPKDVRDALGQSVFKVSTGQADEQRAVVVAAPIIADLKARIKGARASLRTLAVDELAGEYRTRHSADPDSAMGFLVSAAIPRVLDQQGISAKAFWRQVRDAGDDAYAALHRLPDGGAAAGRIDEIIGRATPFLAHLGEWKANATLKPRPLDQAISTLKQCRGGAAADRAAGSQACTGVD